MNTNKNKCICKIKLQRKKQYRLWTFQSIRAIEELKNKGILEASWDRYSETNQFREPYQWMAKQMADRKIDCNSKAPIWAWHSSYSYASAPTLVEARTLLSDIEIADGVQTVEFECPAELVLLSSYRIWNMLLYDYFFSDEEAKIDKRTVDRLFETRMKKFKKYDSIQATIPFLKLEWVKEIRELNLKPNDFTYNQKEIV